ncbi:MULTISPECIES: serine/threonine-protein kinase [unclassified Streptomyces]|uniref:serine/threonine-protein kinase n=1 Tax=unclassified Streptomyces TaxID=2593676 RepID=UPI0024126945|nr:MULTISPECIES: serine/threonine-protein kinase [unclassified Streptomyces]
MGTFIGRYVIEHKLGEGGMGTVYLARSRGGRAVAVKVARPELAADPSFRERFRAEVAAARQVGGFHTAQVVDADPEADAPWLATAYIPGPTLSGLLAAEGPMDEEGLRALGAALAEALEAIHACGLVHRDLKPGNIVMAPDGPRVLDFGIARAVESTRLTATGSAFGTPGYLAPEQALGEEVTGAADVFALGAVLVAAAGGRPFGGGTPMGLMYRSVHEAPDLDAVPEALRGLVGRCLAKDPAERPTPDGLLDELMAGGGVGGMDTDLDGDSDSETGAGAASVLPAVAPVVPPAVTPSVTPSVTPDPRVTPFDALPVLGVAPAAAVPARTPAPEDAVPPRHSLPTRTAGVQDAVPASVPAPGALPVPHPPTFYVPPPPTAPPAPAPDFAAADRNSGIVVDGSGVVLHFFGEEAEFLWSEIGAVRYERVRRERVLRVVVTLYDGSVYDCELDGRRAARVDEWIRFLDPVLRHYLPA